MWCKEYKYNKLIIRNKVYINIYIYYYYYYVFICLFRSKIDTTWRGFISKVQGYSQSYISLLYNKDTYSLPTTDMYITAGECTVPYQILDTTHVLYASMFTRQSNCYYLFLLSGNILKLFDLCNYQWLVIDKPTVIPKFKNEIGVFIILYYL